MISIPLILTTEYNYIFSHEDIKRYSEDAVFNLNNKIVTSSVYNDGVFEKR